MFGLEFGRFRGNDAAVVTDVVSALLQSDVTSDVCVVSATLVDTSIDGIVVTSAFNFLPLLRGKFAPFRPPLLLAFSNASILLTAFDTLMDDVPPMKLLLLVVWPVAAVVVVALAVVVGRVVVGAHVSDVRFPVASTSMSAVILMAVFAVVFRLSFISFASFQFSCLAFRLIFVSFPVERV